MKTFAKSSNPSALFRVVILVLISLSFTASKAGAAETRFCLQNFNVYGPLYATEITERTAAMGKELSRQDPLCEVLQFQEVWRGFHIEQVRNLFLRNYAVSAPNARVNIGLMSLFRQGFGSPLKSQTYEFRVNNEGGVLDNLRDFTGVKKAFHIVQTSLDHLPEEIYFLNTHLHPTSTSVRLTQLLDIYQWRLLHQNLKMVLSGDFNSEIQSIEQDLLRPLLGVHDALERSLGRYPEKFCSYCEENPRAWLKGHHLFDYVYYSNVSSSATSLKADGGIVNLKGKGAYTLSDHYGVQVNLRLLPEVDECSDLEQKRAKYLLSLDRALAILTQESAVHFGPYRKQILEIRQQISRQSGLHWEYFRAFR